MGRGNRAPVNFIPPLSSSDLIPKQRAPQAPTYTRAADPHAHEHFQVPYFTLITTYLSYCVLICVGHLRDFIGYLFFPNHYKHLRTVDGYAPITSGFDTFYHRRLYTRIKDCWSRPVTGVPSRTIQVLERYSNDYNQTYVYTGKTTEMLNLSSYNYLGFAQSEGLCADAVEQAIATHGVSSCSSVMEVGMTKLYKDCCELVAGYIGHEAAMLYSMGFATNSTTIPALIGKGGLIISDELNHASLVFAARLSGANIKVFKHNDIGELEQILRESISQGQPRTHRPWKKILVVVESLYSMEGNICRLPEIVALKKKYNFFLYLDEAHSIGAMGPNGRGICDYFGLNPTDVDICMGTFTKSFGAAGGYIAAKKEVIDHLLLNSHSSVYAEAPSIPVLCQIYKSLKIILGQEGGGEGRTRIEQLAKNSEFFRSELRRMGFLVLGNDSPIVPMLLFQPAKIPAFSREMKKRGIAVVVVGYPATPIISSRARFCISASHTREDLEWALGQISEVGDLLCLKIAK